jgi:hypothetical protein
MASSENNASDGDKHFPSNSAIKKYFSISFPLINKDQSSARPARIFITGFSIYRMYFFV